jgi:hypothetical protein
MPNLRRLPCGFFLVFFTATLFVVWLVLASSAVGQTELAGVYGRITDQSGAVIVDANTTDASVSTVVDQTYVKNMTLNGRSFQDLILLAPGVVTQSPCGGAARAD